MCSPSKKRRRTDTDTQPPETTQCFGTTTPKKTNPTTMTPKKTNPTPRGKTIVLDEHQTSILVELFRKSSSSGKNIPARAHLGGSFVRISKYCPNQDAPFGIDIKGTSSNRHYIPAGRKPDVFIFTYILKWLYNNNDHDVYKLDLDSVCDLLQEQHHIENVKVRVTDIMSRSDELSPMALVEVQEQLGIDMESFKATVVADFESLKATVATDFESLKATVAKVDSRVGSLEHKVDTLGQQFEEMKVKQSQMEVQLIEIQSQQLLQIQSMPNPIYFYSKTCTLNEELRADNATINPVTIKEMQAICASLDLIRPIPGRCFRGVDGGSMPPEWLQTLTVGGTYMDKGFTSTSNLPTVAQHFATLGDQKIRIIFVIDHRSGRHIRDYVCHTYTWEEEVLFKPRVAFTITQVEHNSNGFHFVHMTEN